MYKFIYTSIKYISYIYLDRFMKEFRGTFSTTLAVFFIIIKVFKKLKTSNIYHIVFIYIYNIIENKMEPTSLSESEFDEEISHSGDCAKRKPSESIDEYECIFEPMIDGIDVLIFDETKKRELDENEERRLKNGDRMITFVFQDGKKFRNRFPFSFFKTHISTIAEIIETQHISEFHLTDDRILNIDTLRFLYVYYKFDKAYTEKYENAGRYLAVDVRPTINPDTFYSMLSDYCKLLPNPEKYFDITSDGKQQISNVMLYYGMEFAMCYSMIKNSTILGDETDPSS